MLAMPVAFNSSLESKPRINSIDLLRGIIMIVMALDHVRDFWSQTPFRPDDLSQTTVPLFFTRWITHFCAPLFIFLSGVSMRIYENGRSKKQVSIFLLTRGLWLILLEVSVINFLWQFAYDFILIEVIWAIGWSMICLAGLLWIPRKILLAIILLVIAGHNLVANVEPVTIQNFVLAAIHNSPFVIQIPGLPIAIVAYSIIPWMAVMAAGYWVGEWYQYEQSKRIRLLAITGSMLLLLFVALRLINLYGDPVPWTLQPGGTIFSMLSFINVTKKPPSLLYLLLMLGPAFLFLSVAERLKGSAVSFAKTFGQVPFFFFLLHILLINGSSFVWIKSQFGVSINLAFASARQFPANYQPSLIRAYFVWLLVIAAMYFPCRWYSNYKSGSKSWWLSYL